MVVRPRPGWLAPSAATAVPPPPLRPMQRGLETGAGLRHRNPASGAGRRHPSRRAARRLLGRAPAVARRGAVFIVAQPAPRSEAVERADVLGPRAGLALPARWFSGSSFFSEGETDARARAAMVVRRRGGSRPRQLRRGCPRPNPAHATRT